MKSSIELHGLLHYGWVAAGGHIIYCLIDKAIHRSLGLNAKKIEDSGFLSIEIKKNSMQISIMFIYEWFC